MNPQKKKANVITAACQKGQELVITITDMGTEGEGIGRIEGYTLFVKDAIAGDVARVKVIKTKKSFGYARLLEVITPSRWRIEPECICARQCGGCQLQHCSYEKQLEWKEKKVADCITRIGKIPVIPSVNQAVMSAKHAASDCVKDMHSNYDALKKDENVLTMEPILRMETPFYYRNKAQYPVGYDREGRLVAGFYAGRTHSIIPNTDCAIQHPCHKVILETVLAFMERYGISAYCEENHTGLVRHILIRTGRYTGQVMVCLVINGENLPHQQKLIEDLLSCPLNGTHIKSICLNINREKTNCILGDRIKKLYGESYIEDTIDQIRYQISPLSFYQVNPEQTLKLYRTVMEYADLQGQETVWDLYCGIGTISLFLAQRAAHVYGVEIIPQAVEDARRNARINGISNTKFITGAAEDVVTQEYEKSGGVLRADVVTLDPPRKGCDKKLLETVIRMQPERIVYVSCDPGTLARDLQYLCGKGYELKRVRACDMFPQTGHVEVVTCLHRVNS